ncbi:MAG: class I SAM-dependent methyltransferase [Chloroflexaceae bacterium]|nr:class I SAM-dependent methyltransferase [Chloroflexaceae bacterium]
MMTQPDLLLEDVACPLCGNQHAKTVLNGPDHMLQRGGMFTHRRCHTCHLIYQSPRPVPAALSSIYPPSYQAYQPFSSRSHEHRTDHIQLAHFVHQQHHHPGRLLDVGCGAGDFLVTMHSLYPTWQVSGIDFHQQAVVTAQARGLDVWQCQPEQLAPENSWDAITLFHVLEHLPNPSQALQQLAQRLTLGGKLYVSVPVADSWDAKLFRDYWVGWDLPRHFTVFEQATLHRLCHSSNIQITQIWCYYDSYFFQESLRWLINAQLSRFTIQRIALAFTYSRLLRLLIAPYLALAARYQRASVIVLALEPNTPPNEK